MASGGLHPASVRCQNLCFIKSGRGQQIIVRKEKEKGVRRWGREGGEGRGEWGQAVSIWAKKRLNTKCLDFYRSMKSSDTGKVSQRSSWVCMCPCMCRSYNGPNHLLLILQMWLLLGLRPNITGEKDHPLPPPPPLALKGERCYTRLFLTSQLSSHSLWYPLCAGDTRFKAPWAFGKDHWLFLR